MYKNMEIKNYQQLDLKRVTKTVDIIIPAQTAKLGPPVGPVLGQVKIKVKDFCTMFNDSTTCFKMGLPLPVTVFVYKNETFSFLIKTPVVSFLLKNKILRSSEDTLTLLDLYKISCIKSKDLAHLDTRVIFKNVLMTAKNLKIKILHK